MGDIVDGSRAINPRVSTGRTSGCLMFTRGGQCDWCRMVFYRKRLVRRFFRECSIIDCTEGRLSYGQLISVKVFGSPIQGPHRRLFGCRRQEQVLELFVAARLANIARADALQDADASPLATHASSQVHKIFALGRSVNRIYRSRAIVGGTHGRLGSDYGEQGSETLLCAERNRDRPRGSVPLHGLLDDKRLGSRGAKPSRPLRIRIGSKHAEGFHVFDDLTPVRYHHLSVMLLTTCILSTVRTPWAASSVALLFRLSFFGLGGVSGNNTRPALGCASFIV